MLYSSSLIEDEPLSSARLGGDCIAVAVVFVFDLFDFGFGLDACRFVGLVPSVSSWFVKE